MSVVYETCVCFGTTIPYEEVNKISNYYWEKNTEEICDSDYLRIIDQWCGSDYFLGIMEWVDENHNFPTSLTNYKFKEKNVEGLVKFLNDCPEFQKYVKDFDFCVVPFCC